MLWPREGQDSHISKWNLHQNKEKWTEIVLKKSDLTQLL